jgi:hypothetical protein
MKIFNFINKIFSRTNDVVSKKDRILPVHISFNNSQGPIKADDSIEKVIKILGEPSEQWNDGVEAYLGYQYLTHVLSFEFDVVQESPKQTHVKNCEIWVNLKLPLMNRFDVLTTSELGKIKKVDSCTSHREATGKMAKLNHEFGIAKFWVHPSTSLFEDSDD